MLQMCDIDHNTVGNKSILVLGRPNAFPLLVRAIERHTTRNNRTIFNAR